MQRWLGVAIGGAVVCLLAVILGLWITGPRPLSRAVGDNQPLQTSPAEDSSEYTPVKWFVLGHLFGGDGSAGDSRFKGKLLQVAGFVSKIDKKAAGETCITLQDGPGLSVQCFFGREHEKALSNVTVNQVRMVIIRGRCEGKRGDSVVMRECSLP